MNSRIKLSGKLYGELFEHFYGGKPVSIKDAGIRSVGESSKRIIRQQRESS